MNVRKLMFSILALKEIKLVKSVWEMKSMWSAGKPFHAFMTLSAKKFDMTEILLWCLKSL